MALGPAEVAHGPMLLGTFIALILYGISVTQIYLYWTTYRKKDRMLIKSYVSLVFLADTAHTIFIMAYLYLSLIRHFGDIPYIASSTWLFASEPALVGIIGGLVQMFYSWRVKVLIGSWLLFAVIFLGALTNLLMGIATAIACQIVLDFSQFQKFQAVVIVWAVTAMAADLIIMATLVSHLRHFRTGFRSTDGHIDRIIRLTLQTGMITVVWDLAHLLTFELLATSVHLFFNFTLAKLYTNALLSSLNSRGGWKLMDSENATQRSQRSLYTSEIGGNQHVDLSRPTYPEVFVQVESHAMVDTGRKQDTNLAI